MLWLTENSMLGGGVGFAVGLWVLLILVVVKMVTLVQKAHKHQRALEQFPGPPRHWLFGHVKQIQPVDETGGLKKLDEWTAEYVYGFPVWIGPADGYLNIVHPEYAKTLLAMSEPKDELTYNFLRPWIGDGLLVSSGKKWFRNRRLLTPAFHFGVLQPYTRLFSQSTNIMMAKWKQLGSGASVNVFDHVSLMTLDSLLRCALTVESNCQVDRKQNPYVAAVLGLTKLAVQRLMLFPLHSDLIYYLTPMGYRNRRLCGVVHKHSERVIRDRREALKNQEVEDSRQRGKYLDFLDILLKTKDAEGNGLSEAEIREEVDMFMFAGHDTTASGLSWTLYNLARHPEHQERCRQEAIAVLGGRTEVTGDDLSSLPYITSCVKESLRLYPSVPFAARKLTKSITFPDGKSLPPGSLVAVSLWNIHRNPHVWQDPKVYDPSRFLPENSKGRHSHAYLPFSAGPRNCIGQRFAMNEMKTAVALIMQSFQLTLQDEKNPPVGVASIVLKASDLGIFLKVTPLD